jgi:hypothetical protein
MGDAASIARALKGIKHATGYLCRCPVPSHGKGRGDRSASLSICDGDDGRLLVRCFAACDGRDVLDALRDRGLLDDGRSFHNRDQAPRCEPIEEPPPEPNIEGLELWGRAAPIAGTLAQTYLRNRGLFVDIMPTLRFVPALEHKPSRQTFPAMIALFLAGDRLKLGVQATFLDPRGDGKARIDKPRWNYAPLHDGAVRLGAAGDELGIAEGVETALAAMALTGIPCWACLGAGRMASVAIPDGVRRLHIFADSDKPGIEGADKAAEAHPNIEIIIHLPRENFGDFADISADRAKLGAVA